MAKSATERKREQRTRDKLSAKEKEALLLSRKIVTTLYQNDDAALKRTMARTGIDEEQDLISRFIRDADRMTDPPYITVTPACHQREITSLHPATEGGAIVFSKAMSNCSTAWICA